MSTPSGATAHASQLASAGQSPQAIAVLQQAWQQGLIDADGAMLLGVLLAQKRDLAGGAMALSRACELRPDWAEARHGLAQCLWGSGRPAEAIAHWEHALALNPDLPGAAAGLILACLGASRYDEVARVVLDAAERQTDPTEVVSRFAVDVIYSGRSGAAVAAVREAARRTRASLPLLRALALPILYWEGSTAESISADLRALGEAIGRAHPRDPRPLANPRDPDRPLRIGYVSQDFRSKAAGHFIEPVIASHDADAFQVYAYSTSVTPPDDLTARIRPRCAKWTDVAPSSGLHDGPLAETFRADGIDILVDLVGHPPLNTLACFARRAAPVQVTWMGYPATTGLAEMDYRLIDARTDPEGHERYATERLIRLEPCFLCYAPPPHAPEVSAGPSSRGKGVTFGSFNTAAKLEPSTLRLWARIVRSVPGSRLLLKNHALGSPSVRARFRDLLAGEGLVGPSVELRGETRGKAEHLSAYAEVDVALDPVPYNGTTTTVEALWMGVPVVALAGDRHEARVGLSLLETVGLGELVARDHDGYARVAIDLAKDAPRLASLRTGLRERVRRSPLCDAAGFTKRLEVVYRDLWRRWCAEQAR